MKELWRRSAGLLGAHPVLWVPVLCADLVGFASKVGNHAFNRQIVLSLVQAQHASVLNQSAEVPVSRVNSAGEAALLVASVDLGTRLVTTGFYVIAAILTWALVQTLVVEPTPELGPTIRSVESKGWHIFGLTLLAFGIAVCFSVSPAMLLGVAIPFLHLARNNWRTAIHAISFGGQLLGYLSVAYWITPSAVGLMQTGPRKLVTQENRRDARHFAAFAATASLAISFLYQTAGGSPSALISPTHSWRGMTTGLGVSLLSALPYLVLFIFLSLAAQSGHETALDM